MRSLFALLLGLGAAGVFLMGAMGPLTPAVGFPSLETAIFWCGLPLLGLAVATSMAPQGVVRFLLALLFVAALGLAGYGVIALLNT
jgi:hypothetical protein